MPNGLELDTIVGVWKSLRVQRIVEWACMRQTRETPRLDGSTSISRNNLHPITRLSTHPRTASPPEFPTTHKLALNPSQIARIFFVASFADTQHHGYLPSTRLLNAWPVSRVQVHLQLLFPFPSPSHPQMTKTHISNEAKGGVWTPITPPPPPPPPPLPRMRHAPWFKHLHK